jgi:hypothetical protein
MINRLLALVATVVVAAALAPVASAAPTFLFSGFAPSATFAGTGAHTTLAVPTRTRLTWFTDRPDRAAGATTIGQLARTWDANGFATDPPNAAIAIGVGAQRHTYVLTLTSAAIAGRSARFGYRVLPRGSMLGMRTQGLPATGSHSAVALFIDGGAGCWNSALGAGSDCEMFTFQQYAIPAAAPGAHLNVRLCDANGQAHSYNTTVVNNGQTIWNAPPPSCANGAVTFTVGSTAGASISNGDQTTHIWVTS